MDAEDQKREYSIHRKQNNYLLILTILVYFVQGSRDPQPNKKIFRHDMCFVFSAFTQRKVHGGPHNLAWLQRTWFPTKPGLAACPMNLMNSSNSET